MAGFNITVAGDSAINLEFGNVISEKTNGLIRAAVPQVDAVPQANQKEEDEDALWV